MNLVQLATELEYVPKDQLAQMSQDPNNRFPQYLVLSEIQRRTANEKAYAAAQPQPTTTIAEEVVGEFMQPQGLQAGMPSVSAPTDSFSTEPMGMPASAPMQQPIMGMAEGGKTNFGSPEAVMSQTGSELKRLRKAKEQYQIDDYGRITQLFLDGLIDENQMSKMYRMRTDRFLEDQERGRFKPFYGTKIKSLPNTEKGLQSAMEQSRNEMQQRQQGLASGGLTAFAAGDRTALQTSFGNPFNSLGGSFGTSTNPYPTSTSIVNTSNTTDVSEEEKQAVDANIGSLANLGKDSLKFIGALNEDGSINYLGAGLAIASINPAFRIGRFGAQGVAKLTQKYAPKFADKVKSGLQGAFSRPTNAAERLKAIDAQKLKLGLQPGQAGTLQLANVPSRVFSPLQTLKTAGNLALPAAIINQMGGSDEIEKEKNTDIQKLKTGLGSGKIIPKKENNPMDLVSLGGLIMSSRNMGELGSGLTEFAKNKQARELNERQVVAQERLQSAQASKYEADIKAKGSEEIRNEISLIQDAFEAGTLDQEDLEIQNYVRSLYEALAVRRGGTLQKQTSQQIMANAAAT